MKELDLFDLVAARHDQIQKAAFIGAVARTVGKAMGGAGKVIVKNPLKSVGVAGTGYELQQGFSKGTDLAARARTGIRRNPYTP